jgi:hypothetical protein
VASQLVACRVVLSSIELVSFVKLFLCIDGKVRCEGPILNYEIRLEEPKKTAETSIRTTDLRTSVLIGKFPNKEHFFIC